MTRDDWADSPFSDAMTGLDELRSIVAGNAARGAAECRIPAESVGALI